MAKGTTPEGGNQQPGPMVEESRTIKGYSKAAVDRMVSQLEDDGWVIAEYNKKDKFNAEGEPETVFSAKMTKDTHVIMD